MPLKALANKRKHIKKHWGYIHNFLYAKFCPASLGNRQLCQDKLTTYYQEYQQVDKEFKPFITAMTIIFRGFDNESQSSSAYRTQ